MGLWARVISRPISMSGVGTGEEYEGRGEEGGWGVGGGGGGGGWGRGGGGGGGGWGGGGVVLGGGGVGGGLLTPDTVIDPDEGFVEEEG
jgi:hypothetical protein